MKILSIDIGVKNLSYTLVDIKSLKSELDFEILKWNKINLIHSLDDLEYVSNEYIKWKKDILHEFILKKGLKVINNNPKKDDLHKIIKDYLKKEGIKKTKSGNYNYETIVNNIAEHFKNELNGALYDVVIIENQPCMKNPKMKSMQMIIFTYFCLNTCKNCNVNFISPSEKMKFCKSYKLIKEIPKKDYKKTKELSIEVVQKILNEKKIISKIWKDTLKKDDLSDVLIQAFAYCDKVT